MKNYKLNIFNIILLFKWTFVAPVLLADPTVTVKPVPNAKYHISTPFDGTLTEVADEVAELESNNQGTDIGRCIPYFIDPANITISEKKEDCCMDDNAKGKKWLIKSSDIEVTWEVQKVDIFLPSWSDYDEHCISAQTEWTRWRNVVKTHEDGHRTVVVEFLKESKIKSYYTGETLDFESSCVEESQLTTEKEALVNECKNAMNAIRDEIYTDSLLSKIKINWTRGVELVGI